MEYISEYTSPIGKITIIADDKGLTGLWFNEQNNYSKTIKGKEIIKDTNIIIKTKKWLDIYFRGEEPKIKLTLNLIGTDFQKGVWNILLSIPYSKTISYKDVATKICEKENINKMSYQAIGRAVSKNPVSIIVPCHRVIGTNGNLTGYAGGIKRKKILLDIERKNYEKM